MNVPSPSGTPRLSLAMIVKDEAPRLSDCLAHLQGFSDELVVVDTGSTDGTQDIAADFGCRVATFRWRDDFAAARNAAHRQCSGAWIFVLDPDERIAPADQQAIRALAAQAPVKAYRFITRNYTNARDRNDFVPASPGDPDARGFAGWYPSAKVRLYPNRPEIRFEGAVHEFLLKRRRKSSITTRCCGPKTR